MKADDTYPKSHSLHRLDCGCLRYCDNCSEAKPQNDDLFEFSRNLVGFLGEGWGDLKGWESTELSSLELLSESRFRTDGDE